MGVVEKVKEMLVTKEEILWECTDCGEQFTTTIPEIEPSPETAECSNCGSEDVDELSRSA